VAKPIFVIMLNAHDGKNVAQKVRPLLLFYKTPEENNHPLVENSPNLVTLKASNRIAWSRFYESVSAGSYAQSHEEI
jgi:hypothetical protein